MTIAVVLLLLCLVAAGSGQGGSPADSCTKQINDCACKTSKGYINLDPLDLAKTGGQPKFSNIYDTASNIYSYNPCTAYTYSSTCTNVAACQTDYIGSTYDIGSQDKATFEHDATLGTIIKYVAADGLRTTRVKLMCDSTQDGSLVADGELETTIYDFTLTTKNACSDIAPPPPGGGGGGGLSGGSIMLIIFFVTLTVYLIGGLIFNKVKKGASGVELVPNLEFWKMLPGLAKDGVLFTKSKILGICSSSKQAGYEKY